MTEPPYYTVESISLKDAPYMLHKQRFKLTLIEYSGRQLGSYFWETSIDQYEWDNLPNALQSEWQRTTEQQAIANFAPVVEAHLKKEKACRERPRNGS